MNEQKAKSMQYLRKLFRNNVVVYTNCEHVSNSGMTRHISCYVARGGKIVDITWHVSNVIGYRRAQDGGLVVGGCGMDMGFDVVYTLSSILYRRGFSCIGKECGANDHFNTGAERIRGAHHHKDGGYRLKQYWV